MYDRDVSKYVCYCPKKAQTTNTTKNNHNKNYKKEQENPKEKKNWRDYVSLLKKFNGRNKPKFRYIIYQKLNINELIIIIITNIKKKK